MARLLLVSGRTRVVELRAAIADADGWCSVVFSTPELDV
jgi:hypothetical protein